MAKLKIADYSSAQNLNTDINNIAITGNALPSNFDDALRTVMAHLADMNGGISPLLDKFTLAYFNDTTKKMKFSAANVTPGATRTLTMANQDVDLGTVFANIALAYTRTNILGTVGQSFGTPTGAIIENGFNGNGEYTKFADGTLICFGTSAGIKASIQLPSGIYQSAIIKMTFPAPFIFNPAYLAGHAFDEDRWVNFFDQTFTDVYFRQFSGINNGLFVVAKYIAIGRWF